MRYLPTYTDHRLFTVLRKLDELHGLRVHPNGPWIAGGAVRKVFFDEALGDSDIDVFFSLDPFFNLWHRTLEKIEGAQGKWKTQHTYSAVVPAKGINTEFQLIGGTLFPDVHTLLNDFDLTCCQFAYDGKHIYVGDNSIQDARNERLVVANREKMKISAHHTYRYILKGFTPDKDVLNTMLEAYARDPSEVLHGAGSR